MIATTPRRGRVAAALIAAVAAFAISAVPAYSAQGRPTAVCGGAGNCA